MVDDRDHDAVGVSIAMGLLWPIALVGLLFVSTYISGRSAERVVVYKYKEYKKRLTYEHEQEKNT